MRALLPLLALALPLMVGPLTSAPALAETASDSRDEDPQADFVADNLVAIFYHELGHALIHQLDLPVLGREEDAADILSLLLIDDVWEPEVAEQIVANTAYAYALSAAEREGDDPGFWDVHGHDMQRYYNYVCLFYGADPEGRAALAKSAELPEERAETCAEEHQLAEQSWWTFLEPLAEQAPGTALTLRAVEDTYTAEVIEAEITALNERFDLPYEVVVDVTECDEANAFYIPDESRIVMCTELTTYLREQAKAAEL